MDFLLNNKLCLSKMRTETRKVIRNIFTIDNPKYQDAQKNYRQTENIEPQLKFYEESLKDDIIILPRGAAKRIYMLCNSYNESINIIDNRSILKPVDFVFHGQLRSLQQPAVKSCLKKDFGLLEAPTGSGKTAMALYMIAQRKQPALIVVHTLELLNQWQDKIVQFLGIPMDEIGMIGDGKFKIGKKITVATVQTLRKKVDQVAPCIGYLILDECHRAPAMQYVKVISQFDCKYMSGLTATPWRRDGLSKVIFWHVGDVIGKIDKADLLKTGNLCNAEVHFIKTEFNTTVDASNHYSSAMSEMIKDKARNNLISNTVATTFNNAGINLILSDRRNHCQRLHDMFFENGIKSEVLTGATSSKERQRIIDNLHQGECKYLIATGQLIGEGFDLAGISSIFLTTPIKFSGRLIQYIGRSLRPAPGKNLAVIFDFVDILNPVFTASARSRRYTYKNQKIKEAI